MQDMNANLTSNKLPFWYQVTTASIAGNGNGSVSLTLAADSQFELCYLMGSSSEDADTDFMPNNFSAKITDQSTGRALMNDYIGQRNLCGPANGTIYQKYGVIFSPLSNVLFEVTNLTANASIIKLVMVGYKIFKV